MNAEEGARLDRRTRVLFALQDFVDQHDYQPSLRELAALVGLRSVSSVHAHVRALEDAGLIVQRGERLTVTRDGRPVAELVPVRPAGVMASVLLERWRRLPVVDAAQLRRDIDGLLEPGL